MCSSMRKLLIIGIYIFMQGPEGGESVLIQQLQSLPNLTFQPAVASLPHTIDVPTSQSINATLLKLIIMQRPKSAQQILAGMTHVGNEGSFMNKILLLYMLGLFMVPLREIENPQEASSWKNLRYNFTVCSERKEDQCSTFQYRFISNIPLAKQQRLLNARRIMQIQFERYGVSYTFRKVEKIAQLRYNQPIIENGVQLPSLIKLFAQTNDMHLVFRYDETPKKMELKNFLPIITAIGNRNPHYQFEKVLIEVAEGLERQVKRENKRDKYYLGFTFQHVFIIDSANIDVEIDIAPTSITEWQNSEVLQARSMFLFAMPFKQHENFLMNADRKNIAFIILEVLAAKYNIKRFERQRRELIVVQIGVHVQQFVDFLEEERYIIDGVLLRKIKSWLHLAIDEKQVHKIDSDWQKDDDCGSPNIRNYQFNEIMVQSDHRDKQLENIFFPQQDHRSKSKPSYQPPNIPLLQTISIDITQILQQLQAIRNRHELSNYIATKLTEAQMVGLENQILSDTIFFDKIGFNTKQSLLITYTNCPTCDFKAKMIFYNSCGHGQCLYCFSTYLENQVTKYRHFSVKCHYCTSQLCYSLIKNIAERDTTLKRLYCGLLLLRYAKQNPIKYTYCQNKECQKVPTLYHNKPLCRFILCQSCKNATCIQCALVCHKPKQCKSYNKVKDEVATNVIVKMEEIRWPNFMQRPKLVKECERKLEQAGVIEVLNDNQKMVKEWLTLFLLISSEKRGKHRLGLHDDMLQILSQKVTQLLQDIYQHCENGTQNSMQCINMCIQLQKIRQLRAQIIASAYFV